MKQIQEFKEEFPVRDIIHINIDIDSIFKYVTKASQTCPIEKHLDVDRYDVYDEFIYDKLDGDYIFQDEGFRNFSSEVQRMREFGVEGDEKAFLHSCSALLKIAPKTIKL